MRLLENDFDFNSFGNEQGGGDPAQAGLVSPQQNIRRTLSSMSTIDNLDKSLEAVFKDVVKNGNIVKSLTDQIQRFEIEDFSKSLQAAKTKLGGTAVQNLSKEELQTRDFLNANANNMLDGSGGTNSLTKLAIAESRKNRYEVYQEIPDSNWIAGNMFDVYIQNIFVKNLQNKEFLFVSSNTKKIKKLDTEDDNTHHYLGLLKLFQTYFDYNKKLHNLIVPRSLIYGNYFVEVINTNGLEKFLNTSTLLLENSSNAKKFNEYLSKTYVQKDLKTLMESFSFEISNDLITGSKDDTSGILLENAIIKNGQDLEEVDNTDESKELQESFKDKLKNFLIENKPTALLEENNIFSFLEDLHNEKGDPLEDYKFDDIINLDLEKLTDIQIKGIHPKNVIIIEDESVLYGYLVIEDETTNGDSNEVNIYQRFLSDGSNTKKNTNEENKEVIDKITKYIIDNINELVRMGKNTSGFKFDSLDLPHDSLNSIKTILYNRIKQKSKLKFRFLSSNNLVNFSAPINKYAPYGTSIFDSIVQPIKLYNLALISSIISRLSRASVVRKWNVEAGSKKNHAEIIETVKRDIKNKSISFDNLSNIKNISNVLTDFRDIATIKIDGQSFIDMEIVPMSDRALPLNDLNDLRNDLIAASGVPAVYLNITENVELREHLVNINTNFAQKILLWQSSIEDGLDRLNSIIFTELLKNNKKKNNTFNISNYFNMKLVAPLVLQIQSNEALISSISNIIGLFKSTEFIIDPKTLYKQYIPNMDWDELEKSGEAYIAKKAKQALVDQGQQGGGMM